MDLKLDKTTGDLDDTNNELALVDGIESVEQDWRVRMQAIRGEWFLDTRVGIPYFEYVLVKNPINALLRSVFHQASLDTPGIKEITGFTLQLNSSTRELLADIEGESEDFGSFVFSYKEMILSQQRADI